MLGWTVNGPPGREHCESPGYPSAPVAESITSTVTSTLSMAHLKKTQGQVKNSASSVAEASKAPGPPEEPCSTYLRNNNVDEPKRKKWRKATEIDGASTEDPGSNPAYDFCNSIDTLNV